MATMTRTVLALQKPTFQNGGTALRQRFKETNPHHRPCFGDEAFRLCTSFGTLIGWRIVGDLSHAGVKMCDTLYKLIAEKRADWQCRRPKAKNGQGDLQEPSYSLECFLLGVDESHASPHVTIVCDVEWFSKSLMAIILKSNLLMAHAGWRCFRLPFRVATTAHGSFHGVPPVDQQSEEDPFMVYITGDKMPGSTGGLAVEIWKGTSYFGKATIGGFVKTAVGTFALTIAHIFSPGESPDGQGFQIDESELGFLQEDDCASGSVELSTDTSTIDRDLEILRSAASSQSPAQTAPELSEATGISLSSTSAVDRDMVCLGRLLYLSDVRGDYDSSAPGLDWALISIDWAKLRSLSKKDHQGFERIRPLIYDSGNEIALETPSTTYEGLLVSKAIFGVPSCTEPQRVLVAKVSSVNPGDSGSWAFEPHSRHPIGMLIGSCEPLNQVYLLEMDNILDDIHRQSMHIARIVSQNTQLTLAGTQVTSTNQRPGAEEARPRAKPWAIVCTENGDSDLSPPSLMHAPASPLAGNHTTNPEISSPAKVETIGSPTLPSPRASLGLASIMVLDEPAKVLGPSQTESQKVARLDRVDGQGKAIDGGMTSSSVLLAGSAGLVADPRMMQPSRTVQQKHTPSPQNRHSPYLSAQLIHPASQPQSQADNAKHAQEVPHYAQPSPYRTPESISGYSSADVTAALDYAYPEPWGGPGATGEHTSAGTSEMMAATMPRPQYPPMSYHTPQSNSPASVASPSGHDQSRSMYGQPASQYQMAQHETQHPRVSPSTPSGSQSGANMNAETRPAPATTPLVVRQDQNGVQWIAFEYSRDRVKMEYTIRCDVESVNADELSPEFKQENCVYPRARVPKEQYRGNRLQYETEVNTIGWALAQLNPPLRGKRGLIQRAVDSWRNSMQDPRLRSRRVRRMAKMNSRKAHARQGGTPYVLHTAGAIASASGGLSVPVSLGSGGAGATEKAETQVNPQMSFQSHSGERILDSVMQSWKEASEQV